MAWKFEAGEQLLVRAPEEQGRVDLESAFFRFSPVPHDAITRDPPSGLCRLMPRDGGYTARRVITGLP